MSSSENEETNIPDAATCDRLCREFAEATGTDSACGHYFLQDCDWNLQSAIFVFRSTTGEMKNEFSLLSWNIDGLSEANLGSRTDCVAELILTLKPHVVFLQEVVHLSLNTLLNKLEKQYSDVMKWLPERRYYTVMFLRRDAITVDSHDIIPFENTTMDRDVTVASVTAFGRIKLRLLNSHLESCREYSSQRREQLATCFRLMQSTPDDCISLFGGDLNIRDQEIESIPEDVVDLWEANGSPKGEKFTWDAVSNANIHLNGAFRPRCRFDRLYMKLSKGKQMLQPIGFQLVGRNTIRSALCHPSDHYGILCTFKCSI